MNEKAKTVHEVAKLTGITARTLHYYDKIGLLKPSIITEAKYRQYTDDDLTRLQEILFFREVGFALKEIKELLDSPHYVRSEALERHVLILEAQKERIEALISLVKDTINGNKEIKFSAFSNAKILEFGTRFAMPLTAAVQNAFTLKKNRRWQPSVQVWILPSRQVRWFWISAAVRQTLRFYPWVKSSPVHP